MTDQAKNRIFKVLLTAQEAFPTLEREFIRARHEILAGFRIFDPRTKLRSDEARKTGETWADLIAATLDRGVSITLYLSDFDPVVGLDLHRYTWTCVRALRDAAKASDNPDGLRVVPALHPARVGLLPRLVLWPRLAKEIRSNLEEINQQQIAEKQAFLDHSPLLANLITWRGEKLVPRFRPPPLVPATHHQKLAVFDGARLYIGGLDLNDRRYDTPDHDRDADETWRDAQVLVDGPVVSEAAEHLRSFEAIVDGQRPRPATQLLRTISAKRKIALPFLSPKPVICELADAHRAQVARSETLIYMESQYFRDRVLARQLAKEARKKPHLSLILILPAAPEEVAFVDDPGSDAAYGEYLQTKCVDIVRDAFGDRVFIGSPARPCASHRDDRAAHYGAPLVYLHAKVSIFDDRLGIVSSANLNGRSLKWDTEAGIATQSKDEVACLKARCFTHWLGRNAGQDCFDTPTARLAWQRLADANSKRAPDDRTGFILPYSVIPAEQLGHNLPGVPDEMV